MCLTVLNKLQSHQTSQYLAAPNPTHQGKVQKAHSYANLISDFLLQMMKDYLKGPEFATLTRSCKHFVDITHSKHLWKTLCKRQKPISYPRFEFFIQKQTSDVKKQGLAWQRLYGFQHQGIEPPWKQIFKVGVSRFMGMGADRCDKIAILPNGNIVTSGAMNGHAGAIFSSTGEQINKLLPDSVSFRKIVVLPNGNFVTCPKKCEEKQDFNLRIWDPSGKFLAFLSGHAAAPTDIAFLPNGTIVTVDEGGFICMWSFAGQHIKTIFVHEKSIHCIAALPGGGFVTGCGGRFYKDSGSVAIIWSNDGQKIGTLSGHTRCIQWVAGLPNGNIVTVSSQEDLGRIWSPDGRLLTQFASETVNSMAIMPNGGFVTTFLMNAYILSEDGKLLSILKGHTHCIVSVAVFSDGRIVTGSQDHTVRIWSPTGEHLTTLQGDDEIWCVKLLPNGNILTGGSDAKLRLWSDTDALVQAIPSRSTVCAIS